jgi:hypothetical protein
MIAIEIIACPDSDYLGLWRFHANSLEVGDRQGDIRLPECGLPASALQIRLEDGEVVAEPTKDLAFWHLNGKRATLPRRLKPLDEFVIGNVRARLVETKWEAEESKKEILDRRLAERKKSQDPILGLIKVLSVKTK